MFAQSGMEPISSATVMKVTDRGGSQNVSFRDQMPSYMYKEDAAEDPTRSLQDTNDATLENFFSRPLKIAEYEWGTGTTLAEDFDPWTLYFSNPRVENRITTYKLMKCKMHLKVIINGNGFQYGRALLAYHPKYDVDDFSTHAALVPQDLVQTSQLPHLYLDPTTSTGGEMLLPFFFEKNYLNVPDRDFEKMGKCFLRSLNTLKHANGAADRVTVSVFAWAEDVQLNVLTSRELGSLSPQSGMEKDEIDEANKMGMISGPATTAAKVAGAAAMIPQIRPFALATQTVLNGVAKGAKMLGYSRPALTANPMPYRPSPISHLAATTVPDTAQKLTVDDKQELTIDPTIAGIGCSDPLSILSIAKRESYLTTFDWTVGTSPETLLWNSRISPVTWAESGTTAYHLPACAMAALPFKYWTGSMKFRFQIVSSSFHKGRLKIVYDPEYLATNEYNTNYLEVIDIADTQDFTIEIGNGQERTLLEHHRPGPDSVTQVYSTTAYTAREEGNGVVGVYVVNELTTPNSTVNNDIQINVFVSMGDDFEVFVPDDHFQSMVFKPQLGMEPQSGAEAPIVTESQDTEEPSAPVHTLTDNLGPGPQDNKLINKVFTGEAISSFRPLLKRYNLWRREWFGSSSTSYEKYIERAMYPAYRGRVAGAKDLTGTAIPYNYVNTILLHWVVLAHQGFRGAIRYKFLIDAVGVSSSTNVNSKVYIERMDYKASAWTDATSGSTTYAAEVEAPWEVVKGNSALRRIPLGVNGTAFATSAVNPNIEFEVPFYSRDRFIPGKEENWQTNAPESPLFRANIRSYGTNKSSMDYHVATGEDFQVYFFTGLPRLYYEAAPPSA